MAALSDAAAASPPGARFPMVAAWYGLMVMVVAMVFAAIDRQILLLVTEPLKHALVLSDTQIGALNGIALTLVAAIATFPLGWLADRVERRTLLAVCVLIWSASTAACGLAHTYPLLFAASMGIGVGEAVLGPITYAMIPDLFPRDRWILANYVFFVAGVVGSAAGLSLSGVLIGLIETLHAALPPQFAGVETWRLSLFAVGLPGPAIALMIMFIRKGVRHASEAEARGSGLLEYFRAHWRTLLGVFAGFGFAAAAQGTVSSWMAIALMRVFRESPAHAGLRLGLVGIIGSVSGVLLSGALVRLLTRRHTSLAPMRVAQLGVVVSALLTLLYLVAVTPLHMYLIAAAQITAITVTLSLSPSVLQFIAPRLLRGRVIALGGLLYIAFGSVTPLAVGMVSDVLPAGPKQLLLAMAAVGLPCFAIGALLLRFGETTLAHTMAAAEQE